MKKAIIFLLVSAFILTSCGPQATPTPVPTSTATASPVPTYTAVPTATVTPSPTPVPILFRDDFEGTLDAGWQWVKENKKMWSLTNKPGSLEIIAGSGGVASRNLLILPIPKGNFELETKLTFEPAVNYQIAGLIIYYNGANYIMFGRAFCATCLSDGDGFYFDMNERGKLSTDNFASAAPGTDLVYLRLRREGNTYTSYTSEDGIQWTKHGVHTSEFEPKSVGLAAGQSTKDSMPAQFDYFTISAIP